MTIAHKFSEDIAAAFLWKTIAVFAIGSLASDYYRPSQCGIYTNVVANLARKGVRQVADTIAHVAGQYWRKVICPSAWRPSYLPRRNCTPYVKRNALFQGIMRLK